ncbi:MULTISPECIES: condensation domain-containing protein [Mesorhizobium]|uniref:Condensation domain-containing protein n=1 Tax=Mesorhizobium muleiense TaxID=1004279 RepID=A0A1G9DPE2_9HYPH|nr:MULTISPECIES: condensation domain-containing protein [Mesorhizobium]MCF6101863.1 condensation domain-containing protein [Mesorhizobium muleiense]RUV30851.1 hypothetical protein EOA86_09225 [Mesorhizobium sp. M5C.F.Ca.IN.020.32.2.1]RWP11050.1 MAG: hypothetical protein EOR00_29625 [Mesorhizobium sp.]TIU97128.1 MAG: hypothetical protein E5W09_15635 [Mesorhizobium sp.]SDK65733.1 Condensation domain-containing protein [Mesorhizobium muleiense]
MKLARTIHAMDLALWSPVPTIEDLRCWVPLSSRQQRVWLPSRLMGGSEGCYNRMRLRFRSYLDEAALQSALGGLVARPEVMPTAFGVEDGHQFQLFGLVDAGRPLKRDDRTPAADVETTATALMRHEARAAFEMEAGPLIPGRLVCLAWDDHVVLIMHHMIWDARSQRLAARELYATAREGRAERLNAIAGAVYGPRGLSAPWELCSSCACLAAGPLPEFRNCVGAACQQYRDFRDGPRLAVPRRA